MGKREVAAATPAAAVSEEAAQTLFLIANCL